jgi:murein DD-endopeptidase MepM/ murein hydrolase activator NlpD
MKQGKMSLKKKMMAAGTALVIGMNVIPYNVFANDTISVLNDKQAKIQKEQKLVEQQITEKQAKVTDIEKKQEKLNQEIRKLDSSVEELNQKIRDKENEISVFDERIEELTKEKEKILEQINQRVELIGYRLKTIQENGGNGSYLEVLLGSRSFEDFISRMYAVSTIIHADQELINMHTKDKEKLEKTEKELNENKEKLNSAKKELEDLKAELHRQIEEKKKLIEELNITKETLKSDIFQLEEERELLIAQEEAIKKELRKYQNRKALSLNLPEVTDGNFMRPANGVVTSEFGIRIHPISGKKDGHAGIDIAQSGSSVPIVAAADGTVIRSYYSNSYGNVVFLSHNIDGQVFTTVYAHMQGLVLKEGETVKKGQFIGYMGSTGNSTGQHLHFELHVGPWKPGQPNAVDPRKYIDF